MADNYIYIKKVSYHRFHQWLQPNPPPSFFA